MKQMMKQLGMEMEPIEDIKNVIISTKKGDFIFENAEVVAMTMQGVKTYQITGEPHFKPTSPIIPDDDVKLVMAQTGASEDKVRDVLSETHGDIAEAILRLSPHD